MNIQVAEKRSLDPTFPALMNFEELGTQLHAWVDTFGSPLHVVLPEIAAQNATLWKQSLSEIYPHCKISFALKSCKSESLLRAIAQTGVGADVSSMQEMLSAFKNLVPASKITMTGPAKPDQELHLAMTHGVSIHLDSL